MLKEEAIWLKEQLGQFKPEELSPLLNVGSSTGYFRKTIQPFIHDYIFAFLEDSKITVVHADLESEEGVDISGDLTDSVFLSDLKRRQFRSLLCNNLLEHVNKREEICNALLETIVPGGYLFITVPNIFPYHPHPIDTMFRPGIKDLLKLFPSTSVIASDLVESDRCQFKDSPKTTRYYLGMVRLIFNPFSDFTRWKNFIRYLPYWFVNYRVTCLVLRKEY